MMSNTPATVMPALRQTQHMDKVRTAVACHMPIDSYAVDIHALIKTVDDWYDVWRKFQGPLPSKLEAL